MSFDVQSPSKRKKFVRISDGRDEFNLAEFPLTLLSDKAPSDCKTLEWQDEITDKSTNLPVTRRVIVTGSDRFGLPTASDADVLFALVQLTKQVNNFTSPEVAFSRYELIQILDWGDEGKSYKRLEESLNRWAGATIYFSAWRDKERETWQSETFHIIDNVSLISKGRRELLRAHGQAELAISTFIWNKVIFNNLRVGYVSPLDLDIYFALKRASSKRMLRYLAKHFRLRQQDVLTFDLKQFAVEKIGLSRRYKDAGQIKRELDLAFEELEANGFLKPMTREERYTKVKRGEWTVSIRQASTVRQKLLFESDDSSPIDDRLILALVDRGVTPSTAAELLVSYGPERVEAQLEVFDWLIAKKDKAISKNPAGYLTAAIRTDYAPPKAFESKTDRARRLAEEAARKQLAAEAKRLEVAAKQAEEEAESARVHSYWESLDPAEQKALKEEALANSESPYVQQYRRLKGEPDREKFYLDLVLRIHILRVLDGGTQ